MSIGYNKKKKARRKARSLEEKAIDRGIKSGKYPRFALQGAAKRLPRIADPKYRRPILSWRQIAVKHILLDMLADTAEQKK